MNTEDFIEKLESIFTNLNLSPSTFADQIGVQRSSISHLLSGRNKPSLDFVLKVVDAYPQVDLYWLLGQKEMKQPLKLAPAELFPPTEEKADVVVKEEKKIVKAVDEKIPEKSKSKISLVSEVEKIFIFYTDGTFSEHAPREK